MSIHGIALDDVMTITDSPLCLLDAFEAGDGSVYWIGKRNQFPEDVSVANGIILETRCHHEFTFGMTQT
jgi:hypothetical protein